MPEQNDIVGSMIGTVNGWVQQGDAIWNWIWGSQKAADNKITVTTQTQPQTQQTFFQKYKTPLIIAGVIVGGIGAILVIKKIAA